MRQHILCRSRPGANNFCAEVGQHRINAAAQLGPNVSCKSQGDYAH